MYETERKRFQSWKYFFFCSLSFIHEFKKQCKEQNKEYLLSLLYSGEFEPCEKNKFKEKPGEKMFFKIFVLIKTERN